MNKPYQVIVFDWEGTISDIMGPIIHVVSVEADRLGLGHIDKQKARGFVDLGLNQALKKLLPQISATNHERLVQAVQNALLMHPAEVCLMPGVLELIQRLHDHNIDMAVATNKGQHSLAKAMQVSGLDKYIKVTRCAGQVPAKPCPQMLEEIMQVFAVEPAATLMIGDSISDMEMASKVQVPALGVDFYHQQASSLKAAGALEVFDDYQQLARYIRL